MRRALCLALATAASCAPEPIDGPFEGYLPFTEIAGAALGDTAWLWLECPVGSPNDSAYHFVQNASLYVFSDRPDRAEWELAEFEVEVTDRGGAGVGSTSGLCEHPTEESTHYFYRLGYSRSDASGVELDWPTEPPRRLEVEVDSARLSDLTVDRSDSDITELVGWLQVPGQPAVFSRLCHSRDGFGCDEWGRSERRAP